VGRFVDLSFEIEDGMPALPGFLPEAVVEPILDHEASRDRYQGKAEFYLGRVQMAGNTGTYVDAPFHRHRSGNDLSELPLERLAALPAVVVDGPDAPGPIDIRPADELGGRAVLIRTGWDRRWPEESYWSPGPFLSEGTVDRLLEDGALLVGVDFTNVDDTSNPARPAHTRLLGADVPIVEHLRGLDALPASPFRFFAVPPKIVRGASFPVRAFAEVD
jgi:kynurenine formamidase